MSFLAMANCYIAEFQFAFSFVVELAKAKEEIGEKFGLPFYKVYPTIGRGNCCGTNKPQVEEGVSIYLGKLKQTFAGIVVFTNVFR